jgi:hypothetical protein
LVTPLVLWNIVVVPFDVELADGASSSSREQPLIDAFGMKEVEAGHCPDLFAVFVLHDAHHAFLECFILLSFQEISSDLPLR